MREDRLKAPFSALLSALLLAGCFEVPVREGLQISFDDPGPVTVRAEVTFAESSRETAVRDRLMTVRQAYLDLRDPWTLRFERLAAKHETYEWERSQGELVRVARSARIAPDQISDLFYDTSVTLTYTEREGVAELAMYAGASQRATREQQSEYRDAADRFSRDVHQYLHAMDRLYQYLETRPDRSVVIFAALVGEDGEWEAPSEEEAAMLDLVSEASDRVMEILTTNQERAYSFEEISSLVNDPFPASIVVIPGGAVVEMVGFEKDEASGGLRVPRVSLWSAFDSLRGRWLSPDPLVAVVENSRIESNDPLSPEAFAAEPRFSRPPADWREVRAGLTERLQPAGTWRARWVVGRSETGESR